MNDQVVHMPETFKLEHLAIASVNGGTPRATIRLRMGDAIKEASAEGNGPVDAAYKAVDQVTGFSVQLEDYGVRSVTGEQTAMGEATVKVRDNDHQVIGRAVTTDVIEASVMAYVNAMNKIVEERAMHGIKPPCRTCRNGLVATLIPPGLPRQGRAGGTGPELEDVSDAPGSVAGTRRIGAGARHYILRIDTLNRKPLENQWQKV